MTATALASSGYANYLNTLPTAKPDPQAAQSMQSAKAFESMALSQFFKTMYDSLPTDGPFSGGQGEAAFRSFLVDAMAKKATDAGGIGIANAVYKQHMAKVAASAPIQVGGVGIATGVHKALLQQQGTH